MATVKDSIGELLYRSLASSLSAPAKLPVAFCGYALLVGDERMRRLYASTRAATGFDPKGEIEILPIGVGDRA